MKGLFLKDLFTLTRQVRIFLIMLLVFVLIPGLDLTAFAIVYAAFLPLTAIAYDEYSKWDQLAVMMPYSPLQLVFSKYLLGYTFCFAAAVLSLVIQFVITAVTGAALDPIALASIPLSVAAAMLLQACVLPVIFRLGVEKGRFIFLAIVVLVISLVGFVPKAPSSGPMPSIPVLIGAILLVLIAVNILSIRLSVQLYKKKVLS